MSGFDYRLLPVFANLLRPTPEWRRSSESMRAPYEAQLGEKLARQRRPALPPREFHRQLDQVILDALMETKAAEIAFSPGFRWGTSILPGAPITFEDVMNATAITYPYVTVTEMTGDRRSKHLLEDICDNLFNPDPYYQQGGTWCG